MTQQDGAFQGAIFDVDGVLVDSPHELAWREALQDLMEGRWSDIRDRTSWTAERFTTTVYQQVMAGMAGETPTVARADDFPFRMSFRLLDDPFTVRMESWLPSDTFRRAGFGHVLRGREHVLTLERGVSFVSFDRNAQPSSPVYAASVYAPGPRYRLTTVNRSLARAGVP